MFVFVVANKVTGEIVQCMTDSGDGSKYEEMISSGQLPIVYEGGLPADLFYGSLKDADFTRTYVGGQDSKKIREEARIFPDGKKGDGIVSKCRVEYRAIKAKLNPYDGTVIEDVAKYDEIVAASKIKREAGDAAYKSKMSSSK